MKTTKSEQAPFGLMILTVAMILIIAYVMGDPGSETMAADDTKTVSIGVTEVIETESVITDENNNTIIAVEVQHIDRGTIEVEVPDNSNFGYSADVGK